MYLQASAALAAELHSMTTWRAEAAPEDELKASIELELLVSTTRSMGPRCIASEGHVW